MALKQRLLDKKLILLEEGFLDFNKLRRVLLEGRIFIFPYKEITQSGMFYQIIGTTNLFVASKVGDIADFCIKYDLEELLFDRDEIDSFYIALAYVMNSPEEVLVKIENAKKKYEKDLMKIVYKK